MVIENLNKYSEEQIASLQEKENVIRLIISEQPNRCNLEHLRKYAIKSDTNIQLCLCAEDNNIIKFDVFECLAEKVVDIEIYHRVIPGTNPLHDIDVVRHGRSIR